MKRSFRLEVLEWTVVPCTLQTQKYFSIVRCYCTSYFVGVLSKYGKQLFFFYMSGEREIGLAR